MTLLGSGALGEDDLEELLIMSGRNRDETFRREGRPSAIYSDPLVAQEIRSWVTLADRAATGNAATSSSGGPSTSSLSGGKTKGCGQGKESSNTTSVHFGTHSCWREGDVSINKLDL